MKFSGKVWNDHGTTWLNLGSIRVNGSAGQRSICLLSPAIAQRTGINESVSFARWQQGAGFVVPRTTACFSGKIVLSRSPTDSPSPFFPFLIMSKLLQSAHLNWQTSWFQTRYGGCKSGVPSLSEKGYCLKLEGKAVRAIVTVYLIYHSSMLSPFRNATLIHCFDVVGWVTGRVKDTATTVPKLCIWRIS